MKSRMLVLVGIAALFAGWLAWVSVPRRPADTPQAEVALATPTPIPTAPPLRVDDSTPLARIDDITITKRMFDVTVAPLSEQARGAILSSTGARREHLDSLVTKALYFVMAREKGYDRGSEYIDWYEQVRRSRLIDRALRDELNLESENLTQEGLSNYVKNNAGRLLRAAEAKGYGQDPGFVAWLAIAQMTKLGAITYEHEIENKVHVSDNELYAFYQRHKDLFIVPARFTRAGIIVTATEGAATAAMERIRAGEDFRQVAVQVSLDEKTRHAGGIMQEFVAGHEAGLLGRPDAIGVMLAGAAEGEMVGPVNLSDGSGVLKVYEKVASRQMTFSEARVDQRSDFQRLLEVERRDRLVNELSERVEVEVYADRL